MTITTRESINYQFSLIFGYSSPNEDLIVGDVIGPGKLTKEKVRELSESVIRFLRMYNAILRDFTGSELFSIEFELFNPDKKEKDIKILPKSMILIPGKYKDCESLFLALKPETGILDIHKSRDSINKISELFFEVEEFANRPELNLKQRKNFLKKFASRFSYKLFGELIENKWNKKLVGVSVSLPTEKEMLLPSSILKANIDINWSKKPIEIKLKNPKFNSLKIPLEENALIEHLKYRISEPSSFFIIENTLKLGANLINLANTGTIDEIKERIISFIIGKLNNYFKMLEQTKEVEGIINEIDHEIFKIKEFITNFLNLSKNFLKSGEHGDLNTLLNKFSEFILNRGRIQNDDFSEICNIIINLIEESIITKDNIRAIDLESFFNYFKELVKESIILIKKALPKYLTRRRFIILTENLFNALTNLFNKEQKPAKILGIKFLEKFKEKILNQIENHPLIISAEKYSEDLVIKEFNNLINFHLEPFFENIEISIGDLVYFAETMMEKNSEIIQHHIEKFKKFSGELTYLLSYILRYSTISRFLKEEPDNEIRDPVTFANRFHRFLEKRIGAIKLEWKYYILEWIKDYAKKFFNIETPIEWSLKDVYTDFISYLEDRKNSEIIPENFLKFLDVYITKIENNEERISLLDFFKQYELSIDIKKEFPEYIKNKIKKHLNQKEFQKEKINSVKFLNIERDNPFYNYLEELELKYYSKLVPRPLTLTLIHDLSNEERELFKGDLFHVFNFNYWHRNIKVEISDNFKEVYREWLKEL
ncbi:MAG: hypothetical protein ACP6IY_02340 [Promethearchaeia archaeon]